MINYKYYLTLNKILIVAPYSYLVLCGEIMVYLIMVSLRNSIMKS